MVATRGRTFKRPWRRSCHSSKLKSSSAPIGRKDSWRFHAVGSSNAPLLGSTAAEGLQRIGRTSIATRWRSCGLPQSASCSENFVIPPNVFGQTLRITGILVVGSAVSPTVSSLLGHPDVGTVFADKVLPSLFDNVIQSRIGGFEAYRCVRLDTRVSVPDAEHRSRSEPNTEDLQAIQKGAPREPFVVQLPLYFLGLLQFLPLTHSCLPRSHLTKDVAAGIGFRKSDP